VRAGLVGVSVLCFMTGTAEFVLSFCLNSYCWMHTYVCARVHACMCN
jgi:hypothetical protein